MAKTKKKASINMSMQKKEPGEKCKKSKTKKKRKTSTLKKKRVERNYSVQSIKEALDAIDKGGSFREAAATFGVPKTTLFRFIKSDKPSLNPKKGAPTVLTASEEEDFVKWLLYRAEHGFPVNKKLLLDTVKDYVMSTGKDNPFKDARPGYKWYRLFMKRHSNLSIRCAQNLTSTRASVSENDLRQWFAKLKIYLEEKNLLNLDPKRIFNLDESSFMLVPPKNDAVIAKKGARAIYKVVSSNEKGSLTVLFTAAATGQLLPPMILFDLKTSPRREVLEKIPSDWAVGNTEKGWMTSDSFYKYIVNVFYSWLIENEIEFPVILYADNHSSHLTMQLATFCKEKQIELIGLYPNSTHIIQPLDVGLFHVLKDKYKEANETWRIKNNVIDVKKYMFAEILKSALDSYNFTNCIVNGFRGCGLFPFNPDAVQYNVLSKRKKNKQNLTAEDTVEITDTVSSSSKSDKFLQTFEKELLSPSVLNDFRKNELNEVWTGDIKLHGLFECWRKLRGASDNIVNNTRVVNVTDHIGTEFENLDINNLEIVFQQDLTNSSNNLNQVTNSFNLIEKEDITLNETCSAYESTGSLTPSELQVMNTYVIEETVAEVNELVTTDQYFSWPNDALHDSGIPTPDDSMSSTSAKIAYNTMDSSFNIACFENPQDVSTCVEKTSIKQSTKGEEHSLNDCFLNELEDRPTNLHSESLNLTKQTIGNLKDNTDNCLSNFHSDSEKYAVLDLSTSCSSISMSQSTVTDLNCEKTFTAEKTMLSKTLIQNKKVQDVTTNEDLNICQEILKIAKIPQFQKKKRKVEKSEVTVNTVEKVIENLQKKENEKIFRQNQIELNKKRKEEKKVLKDKEKSVAKSFKEKKRELSDHKKNLNLQNKALKIKIKNEANKENRIVLEDQLKTIISNIEEIDRQLLNAEVESLQSKIKIKKEEI